MPQIHDARGSNVEVYVENMKKATDAIALAADAMARVRGPEDAICLELDEIRWRVHRLRVRGAGPTPMEEEKRMKVVLVEVEGGVAEVTTWPDDMTVYIIDWDNLEVEATKEEVEEIKRVLREEQDLEKAYDLVLRALWY